MSDEKTFSATKAEVDTFCKWYDKHQCKSTCSWTFTQTGIGMNIKVKCVACGAEKDITDYGCW